MTATAAPKSPSEGGLHRTLGNLSIRLADTNDRATLSDLLTHVSALYGYEERQLRFPYLDTRRNYVRHVFCYLGAHGLGKSTAEIGRFLGRDHTTITNSRRRIEEQMEINPEVRQQIDLLMEDVLAGLPVAKRKKLLRPVGITDFRGKRRRQEEEILQKGSIVPYLELALPRDWLIHHSRNGGMSKGENGKAKAMGAKAGFPDLIIMGTRKVRLEGGLETVVPWVYLIEVKTEDKSSQLSSEQRKIHRHLGDLGFSVGVARNIDDVAALLAEWQVPTRRVMWPKVPARA